MAAEQTIGVVYDGLGLLKAARFCAEGPRGASDHQHRGAGRRSEAAKLTGKPERNAVFVGAGRHRSKRSKSHRRKDYSSEQS